MPAEHRVVASFELTLCVSGICPIYRARAVTIPEGRVSDVELDTVCCPRLPSVSQRVFKFMAGG